MRFTLSYVVRFTTVLLFSLQLLANDTFVTLGAGGLIPVRTTQIVMESERLQISTREISVLYVFRNTSDADVDATVAFPLPALDGATLENSPLQLPSTDPENFVDFRVSVDGRSVLPMVEIRAFKNGRDVTNHLRLFVLPVSVLDPHMKNAIDSLSEEKREELEREELIVRDEIQRGKGLPSEEFSWPWWEMRVQYYWRQRFPSRGTVEVLHTYKPVVGGSYINSSDDGSLVVHQYCGGTRDLAQIQKLRAQVPKEREPDIDLNEKTIDYILTTGNNWCGPIRSFSLGIESDTPDDIVLTCMPGLKRVSPTRYEAHFESFRPNRELDVLILQANR